MNSDTEQQKRFLIRLLYFAAVLGIAVFLCRVALPQLWPFCVALAVAWILKPAIRFLRNKCHIQKNIAGVVLAVLFYAVVGLLLALLSVKLFTFLRDLILGIPEFYDKTLEPLLTNVFTRLEDFAQKLDPTAASAYSTALIRITSELETAIATLSKKLLGLATNTAMSLPGGLLSVLIMIIATVFLAIDWDKIVQWVMYQLPAPKQTLVCNVVSTLKSTLGQYIRSYALILGVTWVELSVGLMILGVPSAVGIAALIAVFDILPVVGSGTVLIPWAVVSLIMGSYWRALGLMIIYLVILVVRNVIEPKIVGNRVGLHPIVTLVSMVTGVYVFGPIGLLGLPVTMALINTLNQQGKIHLFQNLLRQPGQKPPREGSKSVFFRKRKNETKQPPREAEQKED